VSGIVLPPPGAHGGDAVRLADALGIAPGDVLDLSASLNPCAPDVAALIAAHASAVNRYPDADRATSALADAMNLDPKRVVLTNGGSEAIVMVASEHPVGRVDEPDFSLYARHLETVDAGAPRWRSNPHNPTGRLAPPGEHAAVWDEAFYPLATGSWTRGDAEALVVGSLTKLFACPGLRAGYVIAPDAPSADRLRARQPEWSVNALVCEVLPELLAVADLPGWATAVARLRSELVDVLLAAGLTPQPSDANYVLVPEAPGVRDHLAGEGLLVRDTESFGLPTGVRIAVPPSHGLERLAEALAGRQT
jgi:histidinol-phosphate/aromatic aminotransferase/cobyric acid decarboxylase-like protein